MIKIIEFYFHTILKLFNQVLQKFEISDGLGFGTFLLGCGLFVLFINLIKFNFVSGGLNELKSKRSEDKVKNAKHVYRGKHERG